MTQLHARLALAWAAALACAPAGADITSNLQAHYRCDGNPLDASGQGRHLTVSAGFAVQQFDLAGRDGRACQFLGNNRLELQGGAPAFPSSSPVTYAFWIRRPALAAQDDETFLQSTSITDATTNAFLVTNLVAGQYLPTPDPGHCCGPKLNVFAFNPNHPFTARSVNSTGLTDGNWHHVTVTSDGTLANTRIYVDGVDQSAVTSGTAGAFAIDLKSQIFLGSRSDFSAGGPSNFQGGLDEVRIYNRELSVADVGELVAAPGISGFPNVTLNEDEAPGVLPFGISDLQTPANSLTVNVTNDNPGMVNFGLGGSGSTRLLAFTNAPNANGVANVQVSVSDGGPVVTQSFSFTLTPVNDAPSFSLAGNIGVQEDGGPQNIAGLALGIDDGDPELNQTLNFIVTLDSGTVGFSVPPAISPAGTLSFTTSPESSGTANVSVFLQDSGGGSNQSPVQNFTINVAPVNDAPSFVAGTSITVGEDQGVQTLPGWASAINDGEPAEVQTLNFVTTVVGGTLGFTTAPSVNANGDLSFEAAPDAAGTATVEVYLQDSGGTANGGQNQSPVQSFTITVTPVNDPPSFTLLFAEVSLEDAGPRTVPNYATAISRGGGNDETAQTLSFTVGSNNPALFSAGPAISPTGTLTYTAAPNANGSASLSVQLMDSGGTANGGMDVSPTLGIDLDVIGENDAPVFLKGADQIVNEDAPPQTQAGWASAIGPGGGPDEAGQTVNFVVTGNTNPGLFDVPPSVSASGALSYTPALDASGTATISLRLDDSGGGPNAQSTVQTFSVTVNPVNDPPSFDLSFFEVSSEDAGPQTVPNYATLISRGGGFDENVQALNFVVTPSNPALFAVPPAIDASGTLTYTAAPNANGNVSLSVQLLDDGGTANGGNNASPTRSIAMSIFAANDPPTFVAGADVVRMASATGVQTVSGFATAIDDGDPEVVQALSFSVVSDNPALFSIPPQIDASGALSFALSGQIGLATVNAILTDDLSAGGPALSSAPDTFTIIAQGTPVVSVVQRNPVATVVGQPFDVRVRVNNPNGQLRPTGMVEVRLLPAGNLVSCSLSPLASPPTAAEALCTGVVAPLAAGKLVQARYLGDPVFFTGTGSDVHTVGPASTRLSIVSDTPDPSDSNAPVTLQYLLEILPPSLAPATAASGQIQVSDGQNLFSAPVNAASPVLTVHPVGSGSIQLTASYIGDANFSGSSDTEMHTLNAVNSADLAVSISNNRSYLDAGAQTTYVLEVRNLGSLSSSAQLDAPVPPGLGGYTWQCTASPGSSCQEASGFNGIVAGLGLAAGGTVSYSILATVNAPEGSQVENRVQITPSIAPPDSNSGNDVAIDSDPVGLFANGFEGP